MVPWGPVRRHSNKETQPTDVGYATLFDTLTKAPKDEWSDPRQEYVVGYFNGMAANEPNTPDITDVRSIGAYDGYMDVNDPENRDYGR